MAAASTMSRMYSQFIVPLVLFALFLSFLQQTSKSQQYLPLGLLDDGERNISVAVQENNDEIMLLQNQWSPTSILRRRHETNNATLIFSSSSMLVVVHSLTSGLLPGYPEPENIYIQLSHYRQRRYLLPSSLRLRLLR